jgi:hypothetical protein
VRVNAGPIAADALFTLAGYGVLNAIGLLRATFVDFLTAVGLAFLAGLSFVLLIGIGLMTVGVPFGLPAFLAVSLATAVVGLALRREWVRGFRAGLRRPGLHDVRARIRRPSPLAWIAIPTLAAFLIYAEEGIQATRWRPLVEWDSWSIWSRKAEVLFHTGTLPTDFFASSSYIFMHADYPILIPLFESIQYRAMGTVDTQAIHWQFFLLVVAFVLAVLYLGHRRGTLFEWLPLGIAAAIVPAAASQLLTAYADIPSALFLALGVLLLGEWLRTYDARFLAIGVLLLAASANTKNEGLMAAAVAFVVVLAETLIARRRVELKALGIGIGAFVLLILPWRAWIAAHGVHSDIPVLKGLNPWYLADRADRVGPSWRSLYAQLIDQASWSYVIPIGVVLTVVCLGVRRLRGLAVFYLATGLLTFAALIWVYWISPTVPLDFFLATSSYRVVAVLAAIAFAALLELVPTARDG